MTDPAEKKGFQPAPWEASKRPTQGPNAPPGYGAPPPAAPPGYGAPQAPAGYMQAPLGGPASNAFGGGDVGRGRTRQIPNQNTPQRTTQPAYPVAPFPNAPQPPAYPPQAPYPQLAPYPQPAGVPPQAYGQAPYPARKPTTILGILSLAAIAVALMAGVISFGIFSPPFLLAGSILGYLGMRETAAWGKKSGRGLAVGGTIGNLVLLVLNVGVLLLGFFALQGAVKDEQKTLHARQDAAAIVKGLTAYQQAKGDLLPGGPQIRHGARTEVAVTGFQLTVADLVSPAELKNPITEYSITITGDSASITWSSPDGFPVQVGEYPDYGMYYDDGYSPPPGGYGYDSWRD
jgi:hypothetical protein